MATQAEFKIDYRTGEFTHYDYKFHACHAGMQTSMRYGDRLCARFISYSTVMAGIVAKGNIYLRKDFDCFSPTTTRQVTRFLSEMCGAPISVNDLRKWCKERESGSTETHCGIAICDIDFIYENF